MSMDDLEAQDAKMADSFARGEAQGRRRAFEETFGQLREALGPHAKEINNWASLVKLVEVVREAATRTTDDPEKDATDDAHPAWWRGDNHGCAMAIECINKILDNRDNFSGIYGFKGLEDLRQRVRLMFENMKRFDRNYWRMDRALRQIEILTRRTPVNSSTNIQIMGLANEALIDDLALSRPVPVPLQVAESRAAEALVTLLDSKTGTQSSGDYVDIHKVPRVA